MTSLLFGGLAVFVGLCLAYFVIKALSSGQSSGKTSQLDQPRQGLNIPDEVRRMAQDPSRKIQAIKLLREANPGMGLAVAKLQVESLQDSRGPISSPAEQGPSWQRGQTPHFSNEAERLALNPNTKIAAIKVLREENPGMGLADAKEAVEIFYAARRGGPE